jgi:hypothetical protein
VGNEEQMSIQLCDLPVLQRFLELLEDGSEALHREAMMQLTPLYMGALG